MSGTKVHPDAKYLPILQKLAGFEGDRWATLTATQEDAVRLDDLRSRGVLNRRYKDSTIKEHIKHTPGTAADYQLADPGKKLLETLTKQ